MFGADFEEDFRDEIRERIPGIEVYNEDTGRYEWEYVVVSPDEIEDFNTPFLSSALTQYRIFKATGILPNGMGTLHEKPTIIEILTLFDSLSNKMESWIYENKKFL